MIQANQKPPESIEINGTVYPVNYHYETWIEVIELIDDIDFELLYNPSASAEDKAEEYEIIAHIEELVFGGILDEDVYSVMKQVTGFASGYPKNNENPMPSNSQRKVLDFRYDLNSILIAIRNQSGIDLIGADGLFHWWLFLLEVENLCGDHRICKIMELRAYEGKDKNMIRARNAVALPMKLNRVEQKIEDEMARIFYNC